MLKTEKLSMKISPELKGRITETANRRNYDNISQYVTDVLDKDTKKKYNTTVTK